MRLLQNHSYKEDSAYVIPVIQDISHPFHDGGFCDSSRILSSLREYPDQTVPAIEFIRYHLLCSFGLVFSRTFFPSSTQGHIRNIPLCRMMSIPLSLPIIPQIGSLCHFDFTFPFSRVSLTFCLSSVRSDDFTTQASAPKTTKLSIHCLQRGPFFRLQVHLTTGGDLAAVSLLLSGTRHGSIRSIHL